MLLLFEEFDDSILKKSKKTEKVMDLATFSSPSSLSATSSSSSSSSSSTKPEGLPLSLFLSRLDGPANYDGLLILATTNKPARQLDQKLIRDGRLRLYEFDYATQWEVLQLLQLNLPNLKFTQHHLDKIGLGDKMLSHATILQCLKELPENATKSTRVLRALKKAVFRNLTSPQPKEAQFAFRKANSAWKDASFDLN